ncbi:glycosyltransferase [uncultured Nocardioides sp.]|uniref:glycosyltransferase n=1 Tax=uncultured Nocardioides sp. TaxID=198441 RepID=UPI002618AFBD|nr:glycosyltransferase [uncultured Nocardioides sp.]
MTRILLVTESAFPAPDGTSGTLKALVDRLVDTGREVRVVAPAPGLRDYRGATVVRVSPLAATGGQVRAAVDAFSPDVVMAVDPTPGPGGLGRKALSQARRTGVPTVVLQRGAVPTGTSALWRTQVADRADLLLATSQWLRGRLATAGVAADVWEPGVDARAFTPALRDEWLHRHWSRASSRPEPLVVVGYAGALRKRHGVRRLAALADVPGVRPVLLGDGQQREWLTQRLPQAKITGALGTGDLAVALASLDVLVHPGEEEGCCHVLRAAAASGVPVVAPRAGGAPEVVRHLETGLLHAAGSTRDLARAVGALAGDSRRALMGARARELAEQRPWTLAIDEMVERLEQQVRVPSLTSR